MAVRSRSRQPPGMGKPTPTRGGANGTRTRNPLLAKQVRYQLRHGPEWVSTDARSYAIAHALAKAKSVTGPAERNGLRWPLPRTLAPMWSQREVINYALQRRSTLEALRRPGRSLARQDACDADPLLIRAAKHHGERAKAACPVCNSTEMRLLHYVFGEQLGQYSGRIKRTAELEEMAHEFGEFKVVVVEVCPPCGWNQMIMSYLLGDGVKRKPPRRQSTVEDIYG
jgi:Family of unknown function (DUF5318)